MDSTVFVVLVGLTSVAGLGTAFLWWRTRSFLSRALRAQGTVTTLTIEKQEHASHGADHPAETSYSYRPRVAFKAGDGTPVEFDSRVAHPRSPMFNEGQSVTIVYDPADPARTGEIEGPAVWRNTIFAAIGTTVLLLVTVFGRACS